MHFIPRRPSPSLVISCLSLFVALSGSAVALQGRNVVASDDIKPGAVKRADLGANAVNGAKVALDSLSGVDIDESTLAISGAGPAPPTGPAGGDLTGTYPNPQLANNSVGAAQIASNGVGGDEIAGNAVQTDEIDNGQVRAGDFGTVTARPGTPVNVAAGNAATATASCASGERMLSGGGATLNAFLNIVQSAPSPSSPNTWTVVYKSYTDGTHQAAAVVLCLQP